MKWSAIQAKLHKVIEDPKSGFHDYTFNEALSILVRERFIARAAQSEVSSRLILKGGLLLTVAYLKKSRFTGDADFNLKQATDLASFQRAVNAIVAVDLEDGFRFSSNDGKVMWNDRRTYDGAQFEIFCTLGEGQKQRFVLDFGVGDIVEPVSLTFPEVIHFASSSLDLLVYPPETIAAEKLQTCISLGNVNSRLKDYFDLYLLRGHVDLQKFILVAQKTFKQPGTDFPGALPFKDVNEMQAGWDRFLRSSQYRVMQEVPKDFKQVMEAIQSFYKTL